MYISAIIFPSCGNLEYYPQLQAVCGYQNISYTLCTIKSLIDLKELNK